MHQLDRDDARPPYIQVADAVRAAIDTGQYQPGDKLPTHAELVSTYGVSVATVKKALATLQADGLITSRRGEGAYIRTAQRQTPAPPEDTARLWAAISELSARLDRVEHQLDRHH